MLIKTGKEVLNFGKHKGKTFFDVLNTSPDYIEWGMCQGIFIIQDASLCSYVIEIIQDNEAGL